MALSNKQIDNKIDKVKVGIFRDMGDNIKAYSMMMTPSEEQVVIYLC